MKLERLPEYLTIIVTLAVGMLLALWLGTSSGGESSTTFKVTFGIIAVLLALFMRTNIWLLIPFAWPLTGQMISLPGSPPLRDVIIVYVLVVFLALKALKVVRSKVQYDWLDFLLLINLVYIASVFVRNPTGTESMGLDRVGGKTYVECAFLFLAYWVIGHFTLSPKLARRLPFLIISSDIISVAISSVTYYFPGVAPALGKIYSGFAVSNETLGLADTAMADRQGYLVSLGVGILRNVYASRSWCTSLFQPNFLIWFYRMFFVIIGVCFILKSGFRSAFFEIALFILLAAYFRDGAVRVALVSIRRIAPLILLIAMHGTLLPKLPYEMQRTLSFLPVGKWDEEVSADAIGSIEWRHDIWINVWTSGNKYIQNWWFGDGFGMTKAQLAAARRLQDSLDQEAIKESLTITGCYHSLPLSAIRAGGYVELVLFTIFLFGMAVYSWILIRKANGTPYLFVAIFVGVPTIVTPLPSLIMSGFFENLLMEGIFSVAILRMISRSLAKYRLEQNPEAAESSEEFPELETNRFPQPALLSP